MGDSCEDRKGDREIMQQYVFPHTYIKCHNYTEQIYFNASTQSGQFMFF